MLCRITDMHNKEVINICDGMRLGCVDDVEVDTCTAQVSALVVYGKSKCFGLFGHEDDIVICWKDIEVIGEHTVLVNIPACSNDKNACKRRRRNHILNGIFGNG